MYNISSTPSSVNNVFSSTIVPVEHAEKVVLALTNKNQRLSSLTNSEVRILQELSAGKLYKEIASDLNVCLDTVKKHCSNSYKKLGVSNRVEAMNMFSGI
jgi:DNA-binding NarL/FixJ family response regulator